MHMDDAVEQARLGIARLEQTFRRIPLFNTTPAPAARGTRRNPPKAEVRPAYPRVVKAVRGHSRATLRGMLSTRPGPTISTPGQRAEAARMRVQALRKRQERTAS